MAFQTPGGGTEHDIFFHAAAKKLPRTKYLARKCELLGKTFVHTLSFNKNVTSQHFFGISTALVLQLSDEAYSDFSVILM